MVLSVQISRCPMTFPKMRFSEQPGRSDPTLHHVGVSPARYVVCSLPHAALWTLDHVGGTQAHVQGGRELQSLHREHLLNTFSQTPRGRFVLALEESGQLFHPFHPFIGIRVQSLSMLF